MIRKKMSFKEIVIINAEICLYILLFLFVLMYIEPEIQPFVYVRF